MNSLQVLALAIEGEDEKADHNCFLNTLVQLMRIVIPYRRVPTQTDKWKCLRSLMESEGEKDVLALRKWLKWDDQRPHVSEERKRCEE